MTTLLFKLIYSQTSNYFWQLAKIESLFCSFNVTFTLTNQELFFLKLSYPIFIKVLTKLDDNHFKSIALCVTKGAWLHMIFGFHIVDLRGWGRDRIYDQIWYTVI